MTINRAPTKAETMTNNPHPRIAAADVPVALSVYQQERHGVEQWRAMRDDGRTIDGLHQIDYPTQNDARMGLRGFFRRDQSMPIVINFKTTSPVGAHAVAIHTTTEHFDD